jgi:hypothetical protein
MNPLPEHFVRRLYRLKGLTINSYFDGIWLALRAEIMTLK